MMDCPMSFNRPDGPMRCPETPKGCAWWNAQTRECGVRSLPDIAKNLREIANR